MLFGAKNSGTYFKISQALNFLDHTKAALAKDSYSLVASFWIPHLSIRYKI
jgi:hypothetical protein